VVIVAAAGNDAPNPNNRPEARYPASFIDVLGVGALPNGATPASGRYQAATYSNLSDRPPKTGYVTLGGEPGSGKGILGVYISEFPILPIGSTLTPDDITYRRKGTGWAWWAGTSFAAPVVSGILASWRSQPGNRAGVFQFRNAGQALNGLSQSIKTDKDEKVVLVMQ
jgi:subtilisin family serine protease